MQRIGIAASKMAKGNLVLYNFYVVLLSSLFSLLIFFISGPSILLGLFVVGYLVNGLTPSDMGPEWMGVIRVCMISLTVVVSLLNLFAILRNARIKNPD